MNRPSMPDQRIIDRLNAELSTIPVPARLSSRTANQSGARNAALLIVTLVVVIAAVGGLLRPSVRGPGSPGALAVATTTPVITIATLEVKTQATILSIGDASFVARITDRNSGEQEVWNGRVVAVHVTPRTVYPNLGVSRLADAHLKPGDVITLTFVPSEYDASVGSYSALVVGQEAVASTPCPVTTARDSSGVIVSSGDIGLLEIRLASFPGEKLIVLVRRGSATGDSLELHATALGPRGGGEVMWSTPATARPTAWGTVVFDVNSKPIGNTGCWRISRLDAPTSDAGIVIDLGGP